MPTVASKLLSTLQYFTGLPETTILRILTLIVLLSYTRRVLSPLLWRLLSWLLYHVRRICRQMRAKSPPSGGESAVAPLPSTRSLTVDRRFLGQLGCLLRVVFPGWLSTESLLLTSHTAALLARTCLSVCVASLEGAGVKHAARGNRTALAIVLRRWLLLAIPATFINSAIRFLRRRMALAVRLRLSEHAYSRYLSPNLVYYRVATQSPPLANVDHSLTDDIDAFSACLTHLYSHTTKPLLDIVVVAAELTRLARAQDSTRSSLPGIVAIGAVVVLTGQILRLVSPPFGRLVAEEAALSAQLRHKHARIIENAEEIAFYRGHEAELGLLRDSCLSLIRHSANIARRRLWYVMLEQFLMKYVWSGCGLAIISLPLLYGRPSDSVGFGERTQYVSTAKNLLQSASDAVERLMTSYKDVYELVGYTDRVYRMLSVFDEVDRWRCCRTATNSHPQGATTVSSDASVARCVGNTGSEALVPTLPSIAEETSLSASQNIGVVRETTDGSIIVRNVSIVAPSGEVIVEDVSMEIFAGMHLLVTGPNGCGKSSLFRVLAGLWPVHTGELYTPPANKFFYIPQRPYLCSGTLRDQLIYPDSVERARERGFSDKHLQHLLSAAQLLYLLQRPAEDEGQQGGWEARADWHSVLSGGEKQRVMMARLLYHRPQFALLDECSNAVSEDVEAAVFEEIQAAGISVISVTHRPSLWRYHTHMLRFDGEGSCWFSELTKDAISVLSAINTS